MTSVRIYIPTLNRVGARNQLTLREFKSCSSHVPVLVCPPAERFAHSEYAPRVLSCPARGIGNTRQWILEHSSADVVIMADDDMGFAYRPDPTVPKLERCTDLDPLISAIVEMVELGYVHGGVGARQGNNRKDMKSPRGGEMLNGHLVVRCERVNNFHFLHREAVLANGGRMDALEVMEDFYFTLDLLLKGVPNCVIHDYVWNQKGSGADGGCSSYRTPQVQSEGARGLHRAFPEFVRVVTKHSSSVWKGIESREDVVVSWVKAARAGGIDV